ncbi:26 kDa periplasmic immunogenic protein precursor [Cognatishimia activa]|uniref:26 kDa periplasmic immunogenic protein n=1 Tax=Cognatishimia activa TaxID=1715691 RepID=A0A0P1IR57_9RHOB|nr:SIMPL domain-containing protein [Cognatishimia activa]CUK24295.1 26 kDa periplasmic immunogenic protein precursor [Cognatishimia activa]
MQILKNFAVVAALSVPVMGEAGEIAVQGRGVVEQAPDMAVITLGARYQAFTAREAMDEVNKRTQAALAIMERLGVEPRDMQTGSLYLNPVWEHGNNRIDVARIKGYEAGNQMTVRIRDLEILGKALDEMVSDGVNAFNGLSFGLQDPSEAMNEARRKAVEDAVAKATLYAEAAGVELGDIKSINEGGISMPQPRFMARTEMAMDSGVPIASGELSTQAIVSIVFEIAED